MQQVTTAADFWNPTTTLASASNLARDLHALGDYQHARELEEWITRQHGA